MPNISQIKKLLLPNAGFVQNQGGGVQPDTGYVLLTDDDGSYLTDDDGSYLQEEAA